MFFNKFISRFKNSISFTSILFTISLAAFSQTDQMRKQNFNVDKNVVAIGGYDPVAYITQQKAVEGNKNNAFNYKGVSYYFSSAANTTLFKAMPEKYEPAYGGWCAFAMGDNGMKVEVDPETFKIIGGKTYLFYNFYFTNTLKSWNKNETGLKTKADANWNKFISK